MILSRDGSHRLLFIEVPEAKSGKNRIHLDLEPVEGRRDDELARLLAHGAVEVADHRGQYGPGTGWVILADPEGNEFCILRNLAEREDGPGLGDLHPRLLTRTRSTKVQVDRAGYARRRARHGTQSATRTTCRRRGPCTPSTRLSSMSLVAEGPLIQVCGRCGSRRARASGTSGTTWSLVHDADVQVGQQGDDAAALAGAVVEHDGAGLGDADGGTGDDRVDGVELGVGQPVVDDRRPGRRARARAARRRMPRRRGRRRRSRRGRLRRSGSRWRGSRRPARRTGRASRPGRPSASAARRPPARRMPCVATVGRAARRPGHGPAPGRRGPRRARRRGRSSLPLVAADPAPPGAERLGRRQRQVAGLGPARPGPRQPGQRAATTRHPTAAAEPARRGRRRARPDPSGRHPPSPRPRRAWPPPRPWARCRRGGRRRPSCAGAPGCRGCRSRPGRRRRRPRTGVDA